MLRKSFHKALTLARTRDKSTGKLMLGHLLQAGGGSELAWRLRAFAAGHIEGKRRCVERMLEVEPDDADICLLSYDYPALQEICESLRRDFAFAVVWKKHSYDMWDEANEPLSVILGSDYILDIDVNAMRKQLYGEVWTDDRVLPIPYEQRAQMWPELQVLCTMSLAARKVFVRLMQSFQIRSGFAECRAQTLFTDGLPKSPEIDEALDELAEAGLIDLRPSTRELLMNLTLKDLKQFAFDRAIGARGPKQRLIGRLIAEVEEKDVKNLLAQKLERETLYIRPLVHNPPVLKKYIWAELDRLELYVDWVRWVECSPSGSFAAPWPASDASERNRDLEPWVRWDDDPREWLTRTELRLVRRIWDPRCDAIVAELAHKYAWDAPWYFGDAIADYLPSQKLRWFERSCDQKKTRGSQNLLMSYGRLRLLEVGVKFPEPRLLKCAGCDKQFIESSVRFSLARRVDHKIHFCGSCYEQALFGRNDRTRRAMSDDEMITQVATLAAALESVPTAGFLNDPTLQGFSEEKQIDVVKALLDMPSYEAYVNEFGFWLRVLILAGILEDGTQRTARGTRCLAEDGHPCLSLGEKAIDDWLSGHNISHEKEPSYPYDSQLNPTGMRADWKASEVLIEYAGLMGEPEYAAKMGLKRELCAKFGIPLVIIEPEDVLTLDKKLGRLIES